MAAFAYGMIIRKQKDLLTSVRGDEREMKQAEERADENKLVTAVAAIIPTEIIAMHALVLSKTTVTGEDGSTTITKPAVLKWSLLVLMALAVLSYIIGRGLKHWGPRDFARTAIPPVAVLVWTGIIGTSALSPWVQGIDPAFVVLAAAGLGVLLIPLSNAINPPRKA